MIDFLGPNPNDKVLTEPGKHEPAAVLRFHRAGMCVDDIAAELGTSVINILREMGEGIAQEAVAYSRGLS